MPRIRDNGTTVDNDGAPVLSILIASYNAEDVLAGCLASIERHPPSCTFEVVVVDDASRDQSAEMVRSRFPWVRLLQNERNLNYGPSNNRAMAAARGRYLHFLNNDTIVLPGALDGLVAFLDQCPRAGAVGSKLVGQDGIIQATVKRRPGPMSALFGARSPLSKLFPGNRFTRRELLHLSQDMSRPFTAGLVSSASMMVRREVVEQIGGLDERLFYHSDTEYCRRIWNAGWEIYYLPTTTIVHLEHRGGSMSSRKRRFTGIVEFHRGSYLYFRKHDLRSPWHPMHAVAVAGLSVRFTMSLLLQVGKELATLVHQHAPFHDFRKAKRTPN